MEIRKTKVFKNWFDSLRDKTIKFRINAWIELLRFGLFGDSKALGDNVSELRMTFCTGYRIYYTMREGDIVLLLVGGDKSTQSKDIELAKKLAGEIE